jgi:uncharacterized protein (DUF433 family)
MNTNATWVSKKPDRCGGEACVRDTRITIWGLIAYRRLGLLDREILDAVQGLTQSDLNAAWEYAAEHDDEIEQAIHDNEQGDAGLVE